VAATHRDLNDLVTEGKFRSDLLYRLNVVPVHMPSLRERADDIPLLVEYFIERFAKRVGKKFKRIDKKTINSRAQWHIAAAGEGIDRSRAGRKSRPRLRAKRRGD